VHGDSAGANLAAVVALMARDAGTPNLRLQSLVYPVADYGLTGDSYEKFAEGYGLLTRQAMVWFRNHYLRSPREAEDWRASPIRVATLAGVAPAIVVTAECDVLHDDGERYAEALRRAGVPVEYKEYPGMIHAFFGMVPVVDDAMNAQRAVWAAFNRATLSNSNWLSSGERPRLPLPRNGLICACAAAVKSTQTANAAHKHSRNRRRIHLSSSSI